MMIPLFAFCPRLPRPSSKDTRSHLLTGCMGWNQAVKPSDKCDSIIGFTKQKVIDN